MLIGQFSTQSVSGGAARAARRLHQALQSEGMNSVFFSLEKAQFSGLHTLTEEENHLTRLYARLMDNVITPGRTSLTNSLFAPPAGGLSFSRSGMLEAFDIIHLHWINGLLSVEEISRLSRSSVPVLWTLHDMWPYTGGCHYSAGCEGYKKDCSRCPQVNNYLHRLVDQSFALKRRSFNPDNLVLVCPSRWMADQAAASCIFEGFRIEVLPNGIETDLFKPSEQPAAHTPPVADGTFNLLFGSWANWEKRKGFQDLMQAVNDCLQNSAFRQAVKEKKVRVMTFGEPDRELVETGITIDTMGHVTDDRILADLYSRASLTVLPSLEDNLPNIILESMACATPLVAYDTGGACDVIVDGQNGRLVNQGDTTALGRAIIDCFENQARTAEMGEQARRLMSAEYDTQKIASRHIELYRELCGHNVKGKSFTPAAVARESAHDEALESEYKRYLVNLVDHLIIDRDRLKAAVNSRSYKMLNRLLKPYRKLRNLFSNKAGRS